MKIFVTLFSELWGLEDWNLVHTWTVGRCIVYSGNRLLLLIHHFISSFSPIFKHWNVSSHFPQELWGLEDWNLVHTWTVGRCIIYTGTKLLLLIHPFFFFFFSLQFSNIKIFHLTFLRNWGLEGWNMLHTWTMGGCIMYTGIMLLLFPFFFLSNFQALKTFLSHILRNCEA